MYDRAISGVLCKNMLLYFAYCDFEETRVKYEKVHSIYQKLLEAEDIDPTLVGYLPAWSDKSKLLLSVLNTVIRPVVFSLILKFLQIFDPIAKHLLFLVKIHDGTFPLLNPSLLIQTCL